MTISEIPIRNGDHHAPSSLSQNAPTNGLSHGTTGSTYTNGMNTNGLDATYANGNGLNGHSANGTVPSSDQSSEVDSMAMSEMPIAICGIGCRLPNGLHTPEQFWEFLLAKGDARSRVPESRYNIDAYYDPSSKPGTIKTEYGHFLNVDLAKVDGNFSQFVRGVLERQDPHQRLLMEVARECIDDAGEVDWQGGLIGCYIGSFGEDWIEMFAKDPQQYGLYRVSNGDFMMANQISYEMDLKGPSMTVRTGCSAALVGLHEACRAIQRGDCTSAIVGGANLMMAPGMSSAMTEQGVLSPDGICKTFSADADGYGRGEAVSAIYIKPLDAALRDGNPIRAIIRSTATNSDGRTPGISMPSTDAHEAMIRQAYKFAGISDFSQTGFVECHGTGTPAGDPIETEAVARIFGGTEQGVYIGSVKPNIGHSEGASGLSSLIKVLLALEHRVIPPNIHFNDPNPNIPFKARNLKVPVEPTPWPEHGGDRASINSFGIGGSNAHVILESPRSYGIVPPVKSIVDKEAPQLLLYSANSTASLQSMIEAYGVYIDENPDKLQELSYTLATGREHLPYRAFSVASSDRHDASQIVKASPSPKLVFVFTGQGAQWPNMGKELLQSNAIFRDSIRSLDGYLRELLGNPKYNLEELISKPMKASQVGLAEISQPLCTAVQLALVGMLAAVNIKAVAVVGHSSGEIAAAYAAGALSAKEAIAIAWFRGTITQQQQKVGAMAAIGMGWNDVEPYLIEGVTVACENSPKSVTISGDRVKVEAVVKHITESPPSGQEVLARLLKVDKAYHSYHMAEIGADYCSLLSDHHVVGGDPRRIPFFSSVTGKLLGTDESLGPRYWQSNLESPVLFSTAVSKILKYPELKETNITFLEVGPHSALAGPLRQILAQASFTAPYVSTMARNQNCTESYLAAIGKLHQIGVPIDLKSLIPRGTQSYLPDLPRYAWDHEKSYWYESRVSKEWRFRKHQYHDLLGVRVAESAGLEPTWRNVFHLDNAPWIRDHKIGEDIVFPFAGYVAIAGEAIRQTTGIQESYALKHVLVNMALVITEGKPVELLTTFRPHRLTDSLDSSWWEFTVASHNGQMWTKHCTGLVRAFEENLGAADATRLLHLPRRLTTPKAYSLMQQAGLNYGPHFQGLSNIEAGTTDRKATAQVQTDQGDEHRYHLHPIVIDACLQLLSVAATKGYSQRHGMVVPTTIESLKIHRCGSGVQVAADADISRLGAIHGSALCVANGETVLQMSGARLSPMPGEDVSEGKDTHATARLEWGPHIDFMDVQNLVHIHPTSSSTTEGRATYLPALEELTGMCLMYTQRRLKQLEGVVPMPHMQTYRDWIDRQLQLPSAAIFGFQAMGDSELFEKAIALVFSLSGTPAEGAATAMSKILSTVTAMYAGRINPLEIFFQDDILTKVNALRDNAWDQTEFVAHLAHSRPNLRILELGAGTGATTSALLQNLTRPDGQVLYSTYTFSDPSPGLVTAAKARFKQSSNIQYATLDIGRDLEAQDFDAKDYDLIIATNVLHATPSLADSLKNVHKLLRPNGRLLLQELWTSSKWANFIFGILQSWWAGVAEGRIEEPYVDKTHWERALNASGLQLDTAVADSNIESLQLNNIMIAHRKEAQVPRKEITVLCFDSEGTVVKAVTQSLTKAGYKVNKRIFGEAMRADEDVLALLDQNGPFFRGIDQSRFEAFKNILNGLGSARLFWVTHLSQINCSDPSYAQILGVARTIRTEMGIDFATCEVDDHQASTDRIAELFAAFQAYEEDEAVKPDFEYAIVDGVVHVGRFHPFALESELVLSTPQDSIVLETEKPGSLVALKWSRRAPQPLDDKFVEIQTYAAGLNFKDILGANGIVELPEEGFGLEGTGIVSRLGPEVKDLKIGDRVMFFSRGAFSTSIIIPEQLCQKIPDNLSLGDAATMACVYATAIYSLFNIGHLEKGQSVLIHSACGGVGIAAIQLARMVGAEIYATVGSEEKVEYLMTTFGIPRNHIFHSRDTSFVDDVFTQTNGKGVDLALNSLSGELLHATWSCVAEFGTMVEIGKRDLLGSGKLAMDVFLANRSYCCVDLDQICFKRRSVCKQLLSSIMEYFEAGHIKPIRPIKIFDASMIREAFRYMQQGQHMGKIVISIRDSPENLKVDTSLTTRLRQVDFDGSASYLLVGGLGGLGRSVSRWMVEHGARSLTFFSRSAGSTEQDQHLVAELQSIGCQVRLFQGSVAIPEDVQKAVAISPNLKGILQMSMVLRDQSWTKMTLDEWNGATEPKVQGTLNLHQASAGIDMDFFVIFSSISGIVGQPGQANYAGANTFLDAFAQYSASLGRRIASVDIGAIEDIGVISNNEGLRRAMKATGAYMIKETELLDAIWAAMSLCSTASESSEGNASNLIRQNGLPTITARNNFVLGLASTVPLNSSKSRALWKKDLRMAAYRNISTTEGASDSSSDALKGFLAEARHDAAILKSADTPAFLAHEMGKKLFSLVLRAEEEIQTSVALSDLGMDSLVAIEMRSWWRQTFGFEISVLELLGMGSLDALGAHATEKLLNALEGEE